MDGKALVNAQVTPPGEKVAAAESIGPRLNSSRRFAVPALAGVVLVLILFAAYYVFTRGAVPQDRQSSPAPRINQTSTPTTTAHHSAPAPIEAPQVEASATLNLETAPTTESNSRASNLNHKVTANVPRTTDTRLTISTDIPPLPRVPPLPRLPAAKPEQKKSNSATAARNAAVNEKRASVSVKRESRVRSLLKRTGRVLAKPFRL